MLLCNFLLVFKLKKHKNKSESAQQALRPCFKSLFTHTRRSLEFRFYALRFSSEVGLFIYSFSFYSSQIQSLFWRILCMQCLSSSFSSSSWTTNGCPLPVRYFIGNKWYFIVHVTHCVAVAIFSMKAFHVNRTLWLRTQPEWFDCGGCKQQHQWHHSDTIMLRSLRCCFCFHFIEAHSRATISRVFFCKTSSQNWSKSRQQCTFQRFHLARLMIRSAKEIK